MKTEKLLCPLRRVVTKRSSGNCTPHITVNAEFRGCYQDKYAWWVSPQKYCAIFAINKGVADIDFTLEKGLNKED